MTPNQLAILISKREGKKHEASIGDIKEILKIIATMAAEHTGPEEELCPIMCLSEYSHKIREKMEAKAKAKAAKKKGKRK